MTRAEILAPRYMTPEQVADLVARAKAKTVWSLVVRAKKASQVASDKRKANAMESRSYKACQFAIAHNVALYAAARDLKVAQSSVYDAWNSYFAEHERPGRSR